MIKILAQMLNEFNKEVKGNSTVLIKFSSKAFDVEKELLKKYVQRDLMEK
ncbi:MAG: hypothetical protein KKB34_01890 [Bacteroidetes bacterium]|nr:hypothetical protein [Bacteroidota bacterium]